MSSAIKVTAKSVICGGIEASKSVKFILAQVAKKLPESKADENHVKHYAGTLVKSGDLDADTAASKYGYKPRGASAKKEKDSTEEVKPTRTRKSKVVVEEAEPAVGVKKPAAKKKKASPKASAESAPKKPVSRRKKAS